MHFYFWVANSYDNSMTESGVVTANQADIAWTEARAQAFKLIGGGCVITKFERVE